MKITAEKEYVEREAIVKMFENAQIISDGEYCGYCTEDINLDNIPTANVVEVVHGEWSIVYVDTGHIDMEMMYKCSVCGSRKYNDYRYCPNCGAKMDGKGGE